ncbi:MAG: hypothetical protein HQL11_05710 [Candidatus Omnitrophica bacterium]|nr:hypothetical protein [Candidatus Omnitrophota bacterium]
MRTKIIALALLVGVCALYTPAAFADSATSGQYTVQAQVGAGLTFNVELKKNDYNGATVQSMNFGQLADLGSNTLRSDPAGTTGTGAVDVFLSANTHSIPYIIKQTGTALTKTGGSAFLPHGACVVTPVYAAADNGGAAIPAGASLGTAGTWVATDKPLYTSEGAGSTRVIQAFYSITDDPAAGSTDFVPLSQEAGTYTANVTFTVVTT